MEKTIVEAVRQFRLGMEAAGSASLVALIDGMLKAMAVPSTSPLSAGELPILQEIIAGQQRGDFLYVADLLEYRLLPKLGEGAKNG